MYWLSRNINTVVEQDSLITSIFITIVALG